MHSLFKSSTYCTNCFCAHIAPSCCTRGEGWGGVWPVSTLVHPHMHCRGQYWTGWVWPVSTLHDSPLHNILWPILDRLGMLLLGVWTVSLCGGGNLRKHNKYSRKLLCDLFMSLEMEFQQTDVCLFDIGHNVKTVCGCSYCTYPQVKFGNGI